MVFREIEKGISSRFRTLKNSASLSRSVLDIIYSIYPKQKSTSLVSEVDFNTQSRTLRIVPMSISAASRFMRDREIIRAALRTEGIDVKKILIKKL